MVKFGRHLATHLVPEWRYKFIDYKLFKKFLKRKVKSLPENVSIFQKRVPYTGYKYRGSELLSAELRQVKYTTLFLPQPINNVLFTGADPGYEPFEVYIQFHSASMANLTYEDDHGAIHFVILPPEGLDSNIKKIESEFFDKITSEINKVNVWYVSKIREYENTLSILSQQLELYETTNMSQYQKYKSTQKLQGAFKELYRGLRYLQNFAVLNEMGFSKVLKKHDKLIRFRSRCTVISLIHHLWFCRRPVLESIINRTENLWAKAFYDGDRSNLKKLRQIPVQISYRDAFGTGIYSGFIIPLLIILFGIALYSPNWSKMRYFLNTLPIYRCLLLGVLFVWGWGFDLYMCHIKGINVTFIFDADADSTLNFLSCLLYASGLSVILLIFFTISVLVEMDHTMKWNIDLVEKFPFPTYWNAIIVLILFILFLIFPFKGLIGKTRSYLFKTLWNIVRAPFVAVQYQDFFLGDQLTSNRRFFTDLAYIFCIIPTKLFSEDKDTGVCNSYKSSVIYITMGIPYLFRFLQCLKRYYDSRIFVHIRNAIKYALLLLSAEAMLSNNTIFWILSAIVSTLYAIFWDLHEDWGLFEFTGRRIRIVPSNRLFKPKTYYLAAIVDIILRCSWMERMFKIKMNKYLLETILAIMEILRRIIWNVFRLENEQLNNCGMFRATKDIPLPFSVNEVQLPRSMSREESDKTFTPNVNIDDNTPSTSPHSPRTISKRVNLKPKSFFKDKYGYTKLKQNNST